MLFLRNVPLVGYIFMVMLSCNCPETWQNTFLSLVS